MLQAFLKLRVFSICQQVKGKKRNKKTQTQQQKNQAMSSTVELLYFLYETD